MAFFVFSCLVVGVLFVVEVLVQPIKVKDRAVRAHIDMIFFIVSLLTFNYNNFLLF
ncbi:hypothetical protein S3E15_02651 [Bacillus mycoides]|uniref:Uncharacterized protein n=1 Tax=Bacillus mycoides TaxID=1405 RepID=A0AAP8BCQ8_BACMY|nr:hypothetical protein bcere0014_8360 [Bacillus cereus BDRD-ST196]OSX90174.1 hypothetical protein S3E15_02651 [Bacillus mycoides]